MSFPRRTKRGPEATRCSLSELFNPEISILTESEVLGVQWVREQETGGWNEPYAVCTMLEWTFMGPTSPRRDSTVDDHSPQLHEIRDDIETSYDMEIIDSTKRTKFQTLHIRLQRDPELLAEYSSAVYENKYAGLAPTADNIPYRWQLPHHPVSHPTNPHKTRTAFKCAARYASHSPNEQLLSGPNPKNSLVGVLFRFRLEKAAIMADIETKFH
ncbi:uncharacterized protein DEA37_0014383 [Paragonimus westermani]|uniref:Uncharacterized protein n=1 Tax=Paragonimus westermani TaxID=34504 RepID=A0A5J4NBV5_9TREM|nr:uncharacterized protein DEA37_0014381 [Paragonimus westermani]KAA3673018.1 uncharacterized protein DEA37_0014383 [Paragonimus westermani]